MNNYVFLTVLSMILFDRVGIDIVLILIHFFNKRKIDEITFAAIQVYFFLLVVIFHTFGNVA